MTFKILTDVEFNGLDFNVKMQLVGYQIILKNK